MRVGDTSSVIEETKRPIPGYVKVVKKAQRENSPDCGQTQGHRPLLGALAWVLVLSLGGCRSGPLPNAEFHERQYRAYQEGRYQEAVRAYEQLILEYPHNAILRNNLAWAYTVVPDKSLRNPRGAIVHARRAVDLSEGKHPAFWDTLAEAYSADGQYEAAIGAMVRAVALAPDSHRYIERLEQLKQAGVAKR